MAAWLLWLPRLTLRAAWWWSALVGGCFFLGTMWWLIHVTLIGWVILSIYLALFFGLFGLGVSWSFTHHPSPITHHFVIPSLWVSLEYFRSHLFSGFGWNLLGYSQTGWSLIVQVADVTGVWGISWFVVFGSVSLASLWRTHVRRSVTDHIDLRFNARRVALVVSLCLGVALAYGSWRIQTLPIGRPVRVAVVQGNIPQEQKWEEETRPNILSTYARLTQQAAASNTVC